MKMGFRWYGSRDDPIPLRYIRQIPGVTQVVGALYDVPVGQAWPAAEIAALRDEVDSAGLSLEVIESVNVHDDIKIGLPTRDRFIANYIATIERLGRAGVRVICYNFMPVFDWLRTDLRFPLDDGSFALAFDQRLVGASVEQTVARMAAESGGYAMPGWEPERLADVTALIGRYGGIDEAGLADNYRYFIQAIMPTCERVDVRMAVHPDDPPWSLYGLPRVVKDAADLRRIESFHDSPYNGFTICCGSLGEDPANDVPAILREFCLRDKVAFVHARNIKHVAPGVFHESAHLSRCGSLDMFQIMLALHECGFQGYVRPDHGRDIWDERGRPGYGLYDRALGIAYLNGLWEAIEKSAGR
jgi:mannonate dehydratase